MRIIIGVLLVIFSHDHFHENMRYFFKADTDSAKRWAIIGCLSAVMAFAYGIGLLCGVCEIPSFYCWNVA